MEVGPGVERRRYVEGENCSDEAYCGCEEMYHVHWLLRFLEGNYSYREFVSADVDHAADQQPDRKG